MKKTALLLILLLSSLARGQFWENPNQKPSLFGMRINRGHLLDDPEALWLFNEGSGNEVIDLSWNGKTISLTSMSWTFDKYGPAIETNANNEYGTLINSSPVVVNSEKGTLVLYFKSNAVFADGVKHCLFGARGAANDEGDLYLTKWNDDFLYFLFQDDTSIHYIRFDSTHFPNWQTGQQITIQWDRSAAIWNSDNMVLLVDGVYRTPTASSAETSWNSFTVDASLGILNDVEDTLDYANGLMSYLYAYNNIKTASEIALLYREPFCFMEPSWNWMLYGGISVTPSGQVIFIN